MTICNMFMTQLFQLYKLLCIVVDVTQMVSMGAPVVSSLNDLSNIIWDVSHKKGP